MEFDGQYLYAITINNKLKKIDVSNGRVMKTFDLGSGNYTKCAMHPYLDEKNKVLFAVGDSKLYKINPINFTEIWTKEMGAGAVEDDVANNRAGPIVVKDFYTDNKSYIIFGHKTNKKFYAYDYDGNKKWEAYIPEGIRAIASYNPNVGCLYIPIFLGFHSGSNKIYVLNVSDGTKKFTITGPRGLSAGRPCTITNNFLIFKTTEDIGIDDYIYFYNATNGDFIKEIYAGKPKFECYPIAVSEGYLITGGQADHTYCWKIGEGKKVDYYPLYGPNKYNYVKNGLTSIVEIDNLK
jgi:outer membrane protein assembly factor BamB